MKKIIYPTNKFEKTWQGKVNFAAKKPDNEKKDGRWLQMLDIYAKRKKEKAKVGEQKKVDQDGHLCKNEQKEKAKETG